MKKIVTHLNPDLDAITACWLIKRFLPGWEKAEIKFVPATLSSKEDNRVQEPDELWVDVGRGRLDHHQTSRLLSAAKLCWVYIKKERTKQSLSPLTVRAVEELVAVVTEIDNARDLLWLEIKRPRHTFYLHLLLGGLKGLSANDKQVLEFGFRALETILLNLKNLWQAKEKLKLGQRFETSWGKGIGVETGNEQLLWQGEKQGFVLVVKKHPRSGAVQIYARPDSRVDLSQVYQIVKQKDPQADWFLHASKKLLLNEASVNPNMKPTRLSLEEIISIIKTVKN